MTSLSSGLHETTRRLEHSWKNNGLLFETDAGKTTVTAWTDPPEDALEELLEQLGEFEFGKVNPAPRSSAKTKRLLEKHLL